MSCEEEEKRVERARAALTDAEFAYKGCIAYIEESTGNPAPPGACYWYSGDITEAQRELDDSEAALRTCRTDAPQPGVLIAEGYVVFLRVHDLKTGWGQAGDELEGEVVFKLDRAPGKAFGFALREGENHPQRQGMLSLLRDALIHQIAVRIEYRVERPSQDNHLAFRVELIRPRPVPGTPESRDPGGLIKG